jgi:hypothetical protein
MTSFNCLKMTFNTQSRPFGVVRLSGVNPVVRPTRLASSSTQSPLVDRPPEDLGYYETARESTLNFVQRNYPQLLDLVENSELPLCLYAPKCSSFCLEGRYVFLQTCMLTGSLMVIPRSEDYVERRSDGYEVTKRSSHGPYTAFRVGISISPLQPVVYCFMAGIRRFYQFLMIVHGNCLVA